MVRDYETKASSIGAVVPWLAAVLPDVVLCKDGSLLACFAFAGIDLGGLASDESDTAVARLEHALRCFDERHILWSTVHRRSSPPYAPGRFPDPTSERIDRLHARAFDLRPQYVNRHYLSVLYRPSSAREAIFGRIARAGARGAGVGAARAKWGALADLLSFDRAAERTAAALDDELRRFAEALDAFVGAAPPVGLVRLAGADLVAFLHDCCSPTSAGQPVASPPPLAAWDTALCDNSVLVGARALRFESAAGAKLCAALTLRQWPDTTRPGIVDDFLSAPGALTLSQIFRVVDADQAARYIKSVQRFNLNLRKSWSSYVREAVAGEESAVTDTGRAIAADAAATALAEITSHGRVFGYLNWSMLLYAGDEATLEELVRAVGSQLRAAGFVVLRETFHLWSAWCGSMPGQWAMPARWQFVSTANLADLCPLRTVREGDPGNAHIARQTGSTAGCLATLETGYRVPYHFNFHQGDLGHTFVVGPSRSGKSVFVNFLLSQFRRYHPVNVIVFDKDRSCRIPVLLHGGEYIDPSEPGRGLRTNPLALVGDPLERDWLAGWLERLLGGRGARIGAAESRAVRGALDDMAGLDPGYWRLRTLHGLLPRELRDELDGWVGDGAGARWFDNAEDSLSLSDLCAVDIGSLLERDGVAPAFMDLAMRRISRLLASDPPRPTAIYLEEAWFLIGHPQYAERVRDWLKTIPKRLGLVVMSTQSLGDLERSSVFESIADNVPTRVFLPNRQAPAFRSLYVERFGLRDSDVDLIRDAVPKRQYYVATPEARRLVEARFAPEMLAFLRSDALAQSVFSRHASSGLSDWRERYLAEMAGVE